MIRKNIKNCNTNTNKNHNYGIDIHNIYTHIYKYIYIYKQTNENDKQLYILTKEKVVINTERKEGIKIKKRMSRKREP